MSYVNAPKAFDIKLNKQNMVVIKMGKLLITIFDNDYIVCEICQ